MIEEQWDQMFNKVVPVVSLGIGILGTTISLTLQRRSLSQRLYSQDGTYLVSTRYPGQWRGIREFVQPDNPDVLSVYRNEGPSTWALYDFVCQNINYRKDFGEFWFTPSETLKGYGDCEDTAILLTSLIRAGGAHNVFVALGEYEGYGHAWVTKDGQIYETTYTRARPVPDPQDYYPYVYFNDRDLIELCPGALDEIFRLRRNEAAKLNLIAQVLEAEHAY